MMPMHPGQLGRLWYLDIAPTLWRPGAPCRHCCQPMRPRRGVLVCERCDAERDMPEA